jgi:hypothetical protein
LTDLSIEVSSFVRTHPVAIYRILPVVTSLTPFPKRLGTLPSIGLDGYFRGCLETRNREQNMPTFACEEEGVCGGTGSRVLRIY